MLNLYKETRVDVTPNSPNSIVRIPIPPADGPQRTEISILSPHTAISNDLTDIPHDEDVFSSKYLAENGAVYFRRRRTHPRAFLWRVVGNRQQLEVRVVDLATRSNPDPIPGTGASADAPLLLQFVFPTLLVREGVALADTEDQEAVTVFAQAVDGRLYVLTLQPEFFQRVGAMDENVEDWCRSMVPAPLAFAAPHRLVASSPYEVLVALDNGTLLRLSRRAGDDGSNWSLVTFDERPWGASLRGLVRWGGSQAVRYGGRTLDINTSNAMAVTSDQAFVFVVNINHTLKVWNLASQKLVGSTDLLGRDVQGNTVSLTLNPAETAFIRVFNAEGATDDTYHVLTYSPHDDGQFKFWGVRGGLTSDLEIRDLFPGTKLRPIDPDATGSVFWNVADFRIKSMDQGQRMALWVLWRSNNMYHVYGLHFTLSNVEHAWESGWVSMVNEGRCDEAPPTLIPYSIDDPTESWLDFLFHPGRFPPEVLGTSLMIYQDATRMSSTMRPDGTLKEQIAATIADSVPLRQLHDGELDFWKYRREQDDKWRQLWQIAEDINRQRLDAISLGYDGYSDLPWLVFSDGCAVVRECSRTELLVHNSAEDLREAHRVMEDSWRHRSVHSELGRRSDEAATLLKLAASFRSKFAPVQESAVQTALDAEIFTEPSTSPAERIAAFDTNARFDLVTDEQFDSLYMDIERTIGFSRKTADLFFVVIDTLPLRFPGKDVELRATAFGQRVTTVGVAEMIGLVRATLTDLLVLAVFLETELAKDESHFDGVDVFAALVALMREYEMMYWLAIRERPVPVRNGGITDDGDEHDHDASRLSTMLDDFAVDIKPRPAAGGVPGSFALTQQVGDVISWITRQGTVPVGNVATFVECELLAMGNIELAVEFARFLPQTAWATYVRGRVCVVRERFDEAAVYFRKAAYVMAYGRAIGNLHEMSSGLIDRDNVHSFYNGLPRYFAHIVALFESAGVPSYVSDFAQLALQAFDSTGQASPTATAATAHSRRHHRQVGVSLHFNHTPDPDQDQDLPDATDVDTGADAAEAAVASASRLRADLLTRLFHASLRTGRFDTAFAALSDYYADDDAAGQSNSPALGSPAPAPLRRPALATFVPALLTAVTPPAQGLRALLALPLLLLPTTTRGLAGAWESEGARDSDDADVADGVDAVLVSLARRQLRTGHGHMRGSDSRRLALGLPRLGSTSGSPVATTIKRGATPNANTTTTASTTATGNLNASAGSQDPEPDYARILQAYRVARHDIRGAAAVCHGMVTRLRTARDRAVWGGAEGAKEAARARGGKGVTKAKGQQHENAVGGVGSNALMTTSGSGNGSGSGGRGAAGRGIDEADDGESAALRRELLALIDLLALMEAEEGAGYVLVEVEDGDGAGDEDGDGRETADDDGDGEIGEADEPLDVDVDGDGDNNNSNGNRNPDTAMEVDPTNTPTTAPFQPPSQRSPSAPSTTKAKPQTKAKPKAAVSRSGSNSNARFSGGLHNHQNHHAVVGHGHGHQRRRRVIVTLVDVRREYQAELDRASRLARGDWAFGGISAQFGVGEGGGNGEDGGGERGGDVEMAM